MKSMSQLMRFVPLLLLTGCPSFVKAPGAPFTSEDTPPDKAVVYFYRPAKKIMSDYPFFMSIPASADNCFQLESGGYYRHTAEPGLLTVDGIAVGRATKTIDLSAGETQYVRVTVSDDTSTMEEVPAGQAKAEIAETQAIETCKERK